MALPDWLYPRDFSFESPARLVLLLVVPLVLALLLVQERRQAKYAVAFSNLDVLAGVVEKGQSMRRWVPLVLLALALATAAAAVAKPRARVAVSQEDATVILLVDVSGSMQAMDVKPSRMVAAVNAMDAFVAQLPHRFKVGLVEFSTEPAVVTEPTTDRDLLSNGIAFLTPSGATAIGDGLATAVRVAESSLRKDGVIYEPGGPPLPVVIVFGSDGTQTRGALSPIQGAERAKRLGIRVDTISVGTPTGFIAYPFGLETVKISVPPDPETMAKISKLTGGESFSAYTGDRLSSIYKSLGSRIGHKTEVRQITSWFAVLAAILLVGGVALARRWGSLLP